PAGSLTGAVLGRSTPGTGALWQGCGAAQGRRTSRGQGAAAGRGRLVPQGCPGATASGRAIMRGSPPLIDCLWAQGTCYNGGQEEAMAFTVSEFRDLIQLLEQHPVWREELRRWVLTEELLVLPQTVHELVESQRHTEERLGQLAGRMDELARHVGQLAISVDELTRRMEQMAEAQLRIGSDLE